MRGPSVAGAVRRLGAAQEGVAAVEMALILPLLLLIVLGAIEFGRIFWTQISLNFAVQEAARCARIRPDLCGTPEQTAAFAATKAAVPAAPASAFTVVEAACGLQVRGEVEHRFIAYRVTGFAPRLQAQVCRP